MTTVLVAEDDAVVRGLVRTIVGLAGYDVAEAVGAAGAWRMLNERDLGALIVDAGPPALDGIELERSIRAASALCDLPVVVLSSEAALVDAAFDAGADSVVTKPFTVRELLDAIADAFDAHRLSEASA